MNSCEECTLKTLRYLDHDLEEQELADFLLHLTSCANCRAHVDAEKELSTTLDRSRPLYSASAALRARVAMAIAQESSSWSTDRPQSRFFHALAGFVQKLPGWRVLTPAAIALVLCLTFVPSIVRNVRAANYVEAAVSEHRSYVDGGLPLGLRSSSPEVVTAWFADKVPFEFRLPTSEASHEGIPAYRLTGAALVSYKGNPAAMVTYEAPDEKISLLAVSNNSAVVSGGDSVHAGTLIFHYYNESQFRVITWTNHGLSYALVSSVSGSAQASCLVCHQNMADSNNFRTKTHQ